MQTLGARWPRCSRRTVTPGCVCTAARHRGGHTRDVTEENFPSTSCPHIFSLCCSSGFCLATAACGSEQSLPASVFTRGKPPYPPLAVSPWETAENELGEQEGEA